GATWADIITSTEDDSTFSWTVPDAPSANCLISITDTDGDPSDTSNAVFTISSGSSEPDPPVISDYAITNGTDLQFTFEDIPVTATMNAYRETTATFTPDKAGGSNRVATGFTDEDPVTPGLQWTDAGVVGDALVNYFYIFTVVDGSESENSNTIGEFDYDLITTSTTDFNEIALPIAITGVSTAADLMAAIPGCNSVARWNASIQGYEMYVDVLPFTNFEVTPGYPYYVNVLSDVGYTLVGELASPVFNLITTATTDFNEIMLPLDKTSITMASTLMTDIPSCNSVARWSSATQGYEQYISILPFTDFGVSVGYPYYVNVTSDVTWPASGGGLKSTSGSGTVLIEKSSAPHLVYGTVKISKTEITPEDLDFTAYFPSSPEEKLNKSSAGCLMKNGTFVIQCNSFASGWSTEEALVVEIRDRNGILLHSSEVPLSYDPADKATNIVMKGDGLYALAQNYPNPFSHETSIEYHIPSEGQVLLEIYSLSGQKIKTLVSAYQQAGTYEVTWNRYDEKDRRVHDGLYIYLLKSQDYVVYKKATVIQ
ncbi:MAG: T9SS type A sorting domain-containing protein, partial [Bacteroidales bacterium]|nr:T9SS type A sorting domain-containing protein [Bacteroidales bacterium]